MWTRTAAGPDEFRRNVRRAIAQRRRSIKLLSSGGIPWRSDTIGHTLHSYEEIAAAAEEAHRWAKPLAVHAMGDETIIAAAKAALTRSSTASSLPRRALRRWPRRARCTARTWPSPPRGTLVILAGKGYPEWFTANAAEAAARHHEMFREAIRLGIPILAGVDDLPEGAGPVGIEMHDDQLGLIAELKLMHANGMTYRAGPADRDQQRGPRRPCRRPARGRWSPASRPTWPSWPAIRWRTLTGSPTSRACGRAAASSGSLPAWNQAGAAAASASHAARSDHERIRSLLTVIASENGGYGMPAAWLAVQHGGTALDAVEAGHPRRRGQPGRPHRRLRRSPEHRRDRRARRVDHGRHDPAGRGRRRPARLPARHYRRPGGYGQHATPSSPAMARPGWPPASASPPTTC